MATIEAMAQVEGPGWMRRQEAIDQSSVSEGEWENSLPRALERLEEGKDTTIYGRGGLNRWFVEADGSISFSEGHAESPEYVQRARELGFVIVP